MLPQELERLDPATCTQLEDLWSTPAARSKEVPLWRILAVALVEPLLRPPGDATSKLTDGIPEAEAAMHADLFWRCAVAVALMPASALEGLAKHHADLAPHLAPRDAPAAERQRALVRCVLPRFSMVCVTAEEARANAKRREEVAAIRRQREEERRRDQEESAQRERGSREQDEGVLL